MLPTAESSNRTAVNRNFYDYDSLITELNTPKEQIQNSLPTPQPGNPVPGNPGINYDPEYPGREIEPGEQIPDEVAALSGKMIAGTIDTSFSTAMGLYARTSETEKYEASEKQMQKLSDAWTAVAKKYNYKVEDSPWFNVILLTAGVYIPKYQDARNDRRFAEMDSRLKQLQQMIEENETRLKVVEKQNDVKK